MPPLACMDTLHFMLRFAKMTPNDFFRNIEIEMFRIIAYHRSITTSKNTWSLERSWNLLQNLSNRDFLAQFVKKLCRNEHSWSELGGVTGSQKSADFGSLSRMEKNNLRSKKLTPRALTSVILTMPFSMWIALHSKVRFWTRRIRIWGQKPRKMTSRVATVALNEHFEHFLWISMVFHSFFHYHLTYNIIINEV